LTEETVLGDFQINGFMALNQPSTVSLAASLTEETVLGDFQINGFMALNQPSTVSLGRCEFDGRDGAG